MPINTDKILKELSKGSADEQYEAWIQIKEAVGKALSEEQKQVENKATELQSKVDRVLNLQ